MNWKIYYTDGTVFEDRLEDAPLTGVQFIEQTKPDGYLEILRNANYYYFVPSDPMWYGSMDGHEALELYFKGYRVLKGERIPYLEFRKRLDERLHAKC